MAYIKNLNYKVENFQLEIPHLEIKDNAITVIMGPSGSGKTTLFNLIIGFISHHNWICEVGGVDLATLEISQRELGVVFQTHELFPHLTAQENVELVMKARGNISAQAYEQLRNFKTLLNLDRCWQTRAQNLSGGEKQRVSLLRAVMSRPRMLLLDEPFSALDEANKTEARNIVKQVLALLKVTALIITHDPEDAKVFGENMVRLENGRVV